MSIGELINLYKDKEINIHPEFQRVFRWSMSQKTKLIESIMLGIPIPPIFVNQNEDGTWDVVDGVQRLSTIFEFVGILQDEDGNDCKPLSLIRTDYLPSFEGIQWNNSVLEKSFTKEQQLFFKRSHMDVIIVKKESDSNTKYELFQRLNTGGSLLSDQEVRNCLMIMTNKKFYNLITKLDGNPDFINCLPISDRKVDEQYRIELLLRLLIATNIQLDKEIKYSELSELLDKETISLCNNDSLNYDYIESCFSKTFNLINTYFEDNSFKKYNGTKFSGSVLSSLFQVIAVGIYKNIDRILENKELDIQTWLNNKVQSLSSDPVYLENTEPGSRAIPRFIKLSQLGFEYFRP